MFRARIVLSEGLERKPGHNPNGVMRKKKLFSVVVAEGDDNSVVINCRDYDSAIDLLGALLRCPNYEVDEGGGTGE